MSKEDSEGKNLYNPFTWIIVINILKFFNRSIAYDIIILGTVIYIFYKSIRRMVKYKKYKHPIIAMILAIFITLLFSVIRVIT